MRARLRRNQKSAPLLGVTVGAILAANAAAAQQAEPAGLEEIVITATRQVDTVNRVPLSITAQTQRNLDQQGIRGIADLQASAPALAVTQQTTPGTANIAIRGISDLGQGASTTGFYLDDTPLQKRNATGAFNGNGTPLPPLFDLERVEVLRGPQGTLFGGSSEGGTVRYITPQPSLNTYSSYARAEISKTKYAGDPSYEAGVAFGGPIIEDKLGFRVSVYDRETAGYTDIVDRVTGLERYEDTNSGSTKVFRGALAWQVTDSFRATLAYLGSKDEWDDTNRRYSKSTTSPYVELPACYNTTGLSGVNNPARVDCATAPVITYTRPGSSVGPYNLDPDQTYTAQFKQPTSTELQVPTLTLDWEPGSFSVKSITSYIRDLTNVRASDSWSQIRDHTTQVVYNGNTLAIPGFQLIPSLPNALYNNGISDGRNSRVGWTQEFRISSSGDARPVSWVAGVFYSNMINNERFDLQYPDLEAISQALYGMSVLQRYGTPLYVEGNFIDGEAKRQRLEDTELAGFAEANWWVTDNLRLTAGLRVSEVKFDFTEVHWGPLHGFNQTQAYTELFRGGLVQNSTKETPVTPKIGAQYQITDNDMLYANVAKGYRAGGVNGGIPQSVCTNAFSSYGLSVDAMPLTFDSDSVMNYELGGKFRVLNNRLQLNTSVYRIDWEDPQLAIALGGGCPAFLGNAGKARSQGIEFEAQALLFDGFTANLGFGYTKAEYTENAIGITGTTRPLYAALKGQKLPIVPLTLSVGGRYDWDINDSVRAYVRADYRYLAKLEDTGPQQFAFDGNTSPSYAPDNTYPSSDRINVRIGVEFGDFDINLFANNLTNSDAGNFSGQRSRCTTEACAVGSFNFYEYYGATTRVSDPRTIGLQAVYRY